MLHDFYHKWNAGVHFLKKADTMHNNFLCLRLLNKCSKFSNFAI